MLGDQAKYAGTQQTLVDTQGRDELDQVAKPYAATMRFDRVTQQRDAQGPGPRRVALEQSMYQALQGGGRFLHDILILLLAGHLIRKPCKPHLILNID